MTTKIKHQATHLTDKEIEGFREILLEKRQQLLGQVENLAKDAAESTSATENSKSPLSNAENASDNYEQDFAFLSMESEEELIRKIDNALDRLNQGLYGICDHSGIEIPKPRLEALPWADLCVESQALEEQGLINRKRDDDELEVLGDMDEANPAGDEDD